MSHYPQLEAAIEDIAADNRAGAAEILRRAADIFRMLAVPSGTFQSPSEPATRLLDDVCLALLDAQPSMAPLANLIAAVQSARAGASDVGQAVQVCAVAAKGYATWAESAAQSAAVHAAKLIAEGHCVLTHSRSSTVLAAMEIAHRDGRRFSVIATESRPMLEGRTLAQRLAELSIPVTLIVDAAAASVMDRVDLVLIGGDTVTSNYLINKIGTHLIALAAGEQGVPVYAVCDSSKFLGSNHTSGQMRENRDSAEIWQDTPAGINVVNQYFEATPLKLITRLITEEGPRTLTSSGSLGAAR